MSFVTLGTVSNGFGPLVSRSSLVEQCRRAAGLGFGYVELRQRSLGPAERRENAPGGDDRPWPLPEALAELRRAMPEFGFNLAVEAAFLTVPLKQPPNQTGPLSSEDAYLARCGEAAAALGGRPPVLRLVDLSPATGLLTEEAQLEALAAGVGEVATLLWRSGVGLALENSKQPVAPLLEVMRRAADRLPAGVPAPRLCWDPHNQISQELLPEDPVETARTLPPERFFEVHFKQGGPGDLWPVVAEGPLAWRAILAALHGNGYRGPALFEIPPGKDIWERLEVSTRYIGSLLGGSLLSEELRQE